jgi:putative FmdB family regulatory protein
VRQAHRGLPDARHEQGVIVVPVYEFLCERCGPFERRRALGEAGDPMPCPACGIEAKRVYSIPHLKTVPTALSNAMKRAERSAHEPELGRRPAASDAEQGHGASHGRPWTLGH